MITLRNEMIDFSLYELKVINNASNFFFWQGGMGGRGGMGGVTIGQMTFGLVLYIIVTACPEEKEFWQNVMESCRYIVHN